MQDEQQRTQSTEGYEGLPQQPVAQPVAQATTQSPYVLESAQNQPTVTEEQSPMAWTASEYILHEKTTGWYAILGLVTIAITAILFFVTRDITVVVLALVGGLVFGFYGSRKPKQIGYEIGSKNLAVDTRSYEYREFKSFSVVSEDAFSSIVLWPHKRFAQSTSIYYPPEYEEQIIGAIGAHLPFEEHNPDLIERLMRHVRF